VQRNYDIKPPEKDKELFRGGALWEAIPAVSQEVERVIN
jgi:hypothetical protein